MKEKFDEEGSWLQGDTPSSKIGGCDYMSFKDASRLFGNYIDCEMRDPCGLNDVAKAMLSYERMIRYLATGKGGGEPAAPTQIDAGELRDLDVALKNADTATQNGEWLIWCGGYEHTQAILKAARAHLAKSKGGV